MKRPEALIDKDYRLERFEGKGGWTFARIPEITQDKNMPFGWVKVSGSIDGYEIRKYHLMPMGDGRLFLPVKAGIRKQIGKQAGDWVRVVLWPDNEPLEVPDELVMCLEDEPSALRFFNSLSDSERRFYIQWIYSAKKEETKYARMAKTINKLSKGLKMHQQE
jgi:hypothetical protein